MPEAVASTSVTTDLLCGLLGFTKTANRPSRCKSSCKSPSCFATSPTLREVVPVTLPPGRLRLTTRPAWDRIDSDHEHKRSGRARSLGSEGGGYAARRRDDGHRPPYEISSQLR